MLVGSLEGGVESAQHFPVVLLQCDQLATPLHFDVQVHYIQHRLVIFVDEHYCPLACLLVGSLQDVAQSQTVGCGVGCVAHVICLFPFAQIHVQHLVQVARVGIVSLSEVDSEHRVGFPFRLQLVDVQPLEELFLAQVIVLQCGDEQALPEASWATKEIDTSFVCEGEYLSGLVNIHISALANFVELLYSYGIFHSECRFTLSFHMQIYSFSFDCGAGGVENVVGRG